jgi:hypothetical protein
MIGVIQHAHVDVRTTTIRDVIVNKTQLPNWVPWWLETPDQNIASRPNFADRDA